MTFTELETVIKAVIANDEIRKDNLTMVYQLPEKQHIALDEHLFFKSNPKAKKSEFKHRDSFEIDTGLFKVMFILDESELDVK